MKIKLVALVLVLTITIIGGGIYTYLNYSKGEKISTNPTKIEYSVSIDLINPESGSITFLVPKIEEEDFVKISSLQKVAGDILGKQYWIIYDYESNIEDAWDMEKVTFDFIAKDEKEFVWKTVVFDSEFVSFYSQLQFKLIIPSGYEIDDIKVENAAEEPLQTSESGRPVLTTQTKANERFHILVTYSKI